MCPILDGEEQNKKRFYFNNKKAVETAKAWRIFVPGQHGAQLQGRDHASVPDNGENSSVARYVDPDGAPACMAPRERVKEFTPSLPRPPRARTGRWRAVSLSPLLALLLILVGLVPTGAAGPSPGRGGIILASPGLTGTA